MKNLAPDRAKWIRVRIVMLTVLLLMGSAAVLHRAYDLQIVRGAGLKEMAEEQYLRDIRLAPKRGTIYDRNGAELAVSVDVDSVWANPRELRRAGRDPVELAQRLSAILGVDGAVLARRLASDKLFVWIERRVTTTEAAAVRALQIPGISMSREARRFYPNRELGAHVLGFANVDGVGMDGIERAFEDELRGSVAAVPAIRDRRGVVVFSEQLLDDRASQGDDIVLTLDKVIQHVAEQELALAVHTFEAKSGSVVVMDPTTGEVLAVANYPTFNPNEPGLFDAGSQRNRAITDRFEPGSTMKVFTVAGALAAGTVRADELVDCENGAMEVAEYTIHDSHRWDYLTPAQILARSSNIGAAKVGSSLGRAGLFRVLRRFGFGENTGIALPAEAAGILRHYRRWYEMDAATISFGQGMSTTTMQLATAMSAIANGGKLMEPTIVRRVTNARGEIERTFLPRVRREVIPEGIARLVSDMMTAVTGPGGTAPEAAIDGYLIAGKTGTAQKADYVAGGYAEDRWTASFAGFVPADRPRLVIAVTIDEPVIAHYGGEVAAPVFRRVGEAALRHLGVPPESGGEALAREARRQRERRVEAERAAVANRAPETGHALAIAMDRPLAQGETRVPDLTGVHARAALGRLAAVHLIAEIEGSGVVLTQEPAPGAVVGAGTHVRLVLARPEIPADEPPPTEEEQAQSTAQAAIAPAARREVLQ